MTVMSAHIILGVADEFTGQPVFPSVVDVNGIETTLWTERTPASLSYYPGWEYRSGTTLEAVIFVLSTPDAQNRVLGVMFVPCDERTGLCPAYDVLAEAMRAANVLTGDWPVSVDGLVPELEADTSDAALATLALWPFGWRVRLPTDDPGDIENDIPPAPPTGPRMLMATLA